MLLAAAYVLDSRIEINPVWLRLAVYFVPYIIVGYDVLIKSLRNILRGDFFDEDFLMSIATVGAFFTSEYAEAVFVMLFFQVGELFQSLAVGKSRRQISALMDIRPDSACVLRNSEEFVVDPDEVEIGEIIVIRPGEKIAIDGIIVEGKTTVDSSALTGESIPLSLGVGDRVVSGSICVSGLIRVRTEKVFGESTVAKILDLVENASSEKSKTENFISRFAKVYTPSVVIAAAILAVVPSLITGDWGVWVHRALTFLVISCPCALVISVPLAYFAGIGGASSRGILVKGSNDAALDKIKEIRERIVNDKADFAEEAKKHSDCPSGAQGGSLGWFGRGMMVPEFDKAAFEMKKGEVSGIVTTEFGYHIIYKADEKGGEKQTLVDVHDQIKDLLRHEARGRAMDAFVQELRSKASIEYK